MKNLNDSSTGLENKYKPVLFTPVFWGFERESIIVKGGDTNLIATGYYYINLGTYDISTAIHCNTTFLVVFFEITIK